MHLTRLNLQPGPDPHMHRDMVCRLESSGQAKAAD